MMRTIHGILVSSDIAYRRVGLLHFTVTQKPRLSNTGVRYSRSDRNHQGKKHIQHSLDHYVLLSRWPSNELVRQIHHRMPAILEPQATTAG
jgi:hypothetical protein